MKFRKTSLFVLVYTLLMVVLALQSASNVPLEVQKQIQESALGFVTQYSPSLVGAQSSRAVPTVASELNLLISELKGIMQGTNPCMDVTEIIDRLCTNVCPDVTVCTACAGWVPKAETELSVCVVSTPPGPAPVEASAELQPGVQGEQPGQDTAVQPDEQGAAPDDTGQEGGAQPSGDEQEPDTQTDDSGYGYP